MSFPDFTTIHVEWLSEVSRCLRDASVQDDASPAYRRLTELIDRHRHLRQLMSSKPDGQRRLQRSK
jgi:hypothetical protein